MERTSIKDPILFILIGYPGSGKSFFASRFAAHTNAVHVHEDRVRTELYGNASHTKQEDEVVFARVDHMIESLVKTGSPIVVDGSNYKLSRRRELKDLVSKSDYKVLLVWVQTDLQTAFDRSRRRDSKSQNDKYNQPMTKTTFKRLASAFKKPYYEDYVVVSGKHVFNNQFAAISKKLNKQKTKSENKRPKEPQKLDAAESKKLLGGRVDLKRRATSTKR